MSRATRLIFLAAALVFAVISAGAIQGRSPLRPTSPRLIEGLTDAVEVPLPPPEVVVGVWDQLPRSDESHPTIAIPFTPEIDRPFVLRVLLRAPSKGAPAVVVHALTGEEAAAFGNQPKAIGAPYPGLRALPCYAFDESGTGISGCQVQSSLNHHRPHGLILVTGVEPKRVEVFDADLPDPRAPENPVSNRLIRRVANLTETGMSWRSALVARAMSRYVFDVVLPDRPQLWLAAGHEAGVFEGAVRFLVRQDSRVLLDEVVQPDGKWHDYALNLWGNKGDKSRLSLETLAVDPSRASRGLWADPRLLGSSDSPNILLVTLDAVRADHTSAYGYGRDTTPALAGVAGLGVQFDRATSQAGHTWESMMGVFSGLYPIHSGAMQIGSMPPPELPLLPDLLSRAGYDTFALNDLAMYPGHNMSSFDEAEILLIPNGDADTEPKGSPVFQFRRFVARHAQVPWFGWVHLENAHYRLVPREPRRYDPEYEGRFRDRLTISEHEKYYLPGDLSPEETEHIIALYDSSIRDADNELRQILTDLNSSGQWNDTIVVVTADHGTNLGQHGVIIEHVLPYDAVLHVPMVIAWGDHLVAGHRVTQRVQVIDLFPTLLSMVGLSVPSFTDGHDLSAALHGADLPERPAYAEMAAGVFSLHQGSEHLLHNSNGLALNHGRAKLLIRPDELYDLQTDPNEEHDLSKSNAALVAKMTGTLNAEMRRWGTAEAWGNDGHLSQSAVRALREAGYLHDFSAAPDGGSPPDP